MFYIKYNYLNFDMNIREIQKNIVIDIINIKKLLYSGYCFKKHLFFINDYNFNIKTNVNKNTIIEIFRKLCYYKNIVVRPVDQ